MYTNRFFAIGSSSSSDESSDDEQQIQISTARPEDFLRGNTIDNDNHKQNVKHVVQSEKEKRCREIEEIIKKIKQGMDIRDINQVYECFENLINTYEKARRVVENEQIAPGFHTEILIQLDDFVDKCWNDENWRETLNRTTFNKLKILRQKLRRYLQQQSFEKKNESVDEQVVSSDEDEDTLKKLNEIIALRGKRGMNYQEQSDGLNNLRENIDEQNLDLEVKILLTQITIGFDYLQHGKQEIWIRTLDYIEELLKLLSENVNLKVTSDDLITIVLQMNEEFTKILLNIDHHSHDYIERLKDEFRICSLLDQFKLYFELNNHENIHLCTIYLCIIEHIYYKTSDQTSMVLIDRLCKYIYTNDTLNRARARASLCHIYHLALHNHYNEARDLMLMSHMQDTIHSSDISTQVLYNRTMVQLGLCAFRYGAIHEAHQILVDIQSGHRIKELLGQDIHTMNIPFHMHINLQLIECIYLISAMLIEIPSRKNHSISRHFYILMRQAENQPITGPPESIREHIVAATHALKTGDWHACVDFLINDKMNNQIWNLMPLVSEMLINKIKEESLRMYLFTYGNVFDTVGISMLVDMFELSNKQVYGIICKMIINKELRASIEDVNQIVVMHTKDSSGIYDLSVELMEKTFRLYEQNEKLNKNFLK